MRSEEPTDLVKDAVGMVQDQVVGQTKDDKTGGRKPSIATAVAQGPWVVRGTISFDNEACLLAEEIDDERSDGMLAAELGPHDLPAAQHLPKHPFGRGASTSQSTRHTGPGSRQPGHAWLSAVRRRRLPPGMFPAPLSVPERGWG
jgi:hypothetical protein